MGIVIAGFSPQDKVPGPYGEVLPGTGATSASSIPLKMLIAGLKTSAGTATANVDLVPITSVSDAINSFGAKSQVRRMAEIALRYPGINLYGIAIAEAGGGTAAVFTITLTGSWSTVGTFSFRLAGESYSGVIGASDTVTIAAASIRDAFNANPACPFIATASVGVITLTAANVGTTPNKYILFNTSVGPSGFVCTPSGGASVTGGGIFPTAGTGTEDVTTALSALINTTFDRIALGQVDSANGVLWSNQLVTQSGVLSGRLQHAVMGSTSAVATTITLASSSLNAYRMQVVECLNGETHPAEMASSMCALRIQAEQAYPNANFDGLQLLGVAPQTQLADRPNHATLVSMLNNGVTPTQTTPDGKVTVVRSIVTHCLNGATPDYNTLDTSDAVVPDFVLTSILLAWIPVAKNNPVAADDSSFTSKRLPGGVITPDTWNAKVYDIHKKLESGDGFIGPVLMQVDANKPISLWDSVGKRIMTVAQPIAATKPHQMGVSVRPLAAA